MVYKNNKITYQELLTLLESNPDNQELNDLKTLYDRLTKDLINSNVFEPNHKKYYSKK
jgi:hypothetical protein